MIATLSSPLLWGFRQLVTVALITPAEECVYTYVRVCVCLCLPWRRSRSQLSTLNADFNCHVNQKQMNPAERKFSHWRCWHAQLNRVHSKIRFRRPIRFLPLSQFPCNWKSWITDGNVSSSQHCRAMWVFSAGLWCRDSSVRSGPSSRDKNLVFCALWDVEFVFQQVKRKKNLAPKKALPSENERTQRACFIFGKPPAGQWSNQHPKLWRGSVAFHNLPCYIRLKGLSEWTHLAKPMNSISWEDILLQDCNQPVACSLVNQSVRSALTIHVLL